MQIQVREWENSQGIRLPKEILKNAGIAINEVLEVSVSNGVITLAKPFRHKTLEVVHQGDILNIEKIKHPVLVVSKDFFNTSDEIIGCPIIQNSMPGPLHIWMSTEENEGYIQCEKLALLDLSVGGYKKIDRLPISEMMNVSDAIQSIFEYT